MFQLIQLMRLTYLITENEPTKSICSTGKTTKKVVEIEKDAEENNNIDDFRRWMSF